MRCGGQTGPIPCPAKRSYSPGMLDLNRKADMKGASPCWCDNRGAYALRSPGFRDSLLLRSFGLLDADQRELLRVLLAKMDEDLGFVLRQVGDPCLVDDVLLVADGPGGPLRVLVHRAVHGKVVVRQGVVVVAPDDS